jgi:uncharacterized protein GlcG (DUF336 family)
MSTLTLAQANTIINAALALAGQRGFAPLTAVVLDPGGHVVAIQRQDRSGILRVEIATGKAYGALGLGLGSRALAERAKVNPEFIAAASVASGGRLVPVPGGVLALSTQGDILGAVGISGETSDNDEACAVAGIEAVSLVPKIST